MHIFLLSRGPLAADLMFVDPLPAPEAGGETPLCIRRQATESMPSHKTKHLIQRQHIPANKTIQSTAHEIYSESMPSRGRHGSVSDFRGEASVPHRHPLHDIVSTDDNDYSINNSDDSNHHNPNRPFPLSVSGWPTPLTTPHPRNAPSFKRRAGVDLLVGLCCPSDKSQSG